MSSPILLFAIWARPSTQTLIVCVVMVVLCVGFGYRFRRHGLPILGTVVLMLAIPWGFALALFALDQVGIMDPYEPEPNSNRIVIQDERDTVYMETPSIEHPRPTATATATAAP